MRTVPLGNVKSSPSTRQPETSKAKFVEVFAISTKSPSGVLEWYMISLKTTLPCGEIPGPLYCTLTVFAVPGTARPLLS